MYIWDGLLLQSTENMEMLTQLQSEQHISKELAARLGHQEEELKEIRELVGASVKLNMRRWRTSEVHNLFGPSSKNRKRFV